MWITRLFVSHPIVESQFRKLERGNCTAIDDSLFLVGNMNFSWGTCFSRGEHNFTGVWRANFIDLGTSEIMFPTRKTCSPREQHVPQYAPSMHKIFDTRHDHCVPTESFGRGSHSVWAQLEGVQGGRYHFIACLFLSLVPYHTPPAGPTYPLTNPTNEEQVVQNVQTFNTVVYKTTTFTVGDWVQVKGSIRTSYQLSLCAQENETMHCMVHATWWVSCTTQGTKVHAGDIWYG